MSNIFAKLKKIFHKDKVTVESFEQDGNTTSKIHATISHFKTFSLIALVIFAFVFYYFMLFPINLKSLQFDMYLLVLFGILTFIFFVDSFANNTSKKIYKFLISLAALLVIAIILSNLYSSPIFHAKRYANMLQKETADFVKDFPEADFNTLPVVDRETAVKLGARKMGEMGDLVSQYDIDETYSQINLAGKPVRVTPLVYADVIKWFLNKSDGIPYYISIDMVTQNSSLVKLEKPIKYSMSDKFGRYLYRHVRFNYPTAIIGEINFELDDEKNPYYVVSAIEPTIGLFGAPDVKYVIVVDAITGKTEKYTPTEAPEWIDRVYPSNLVLAQLYNNGQYQKGFINSKIKQDGVTKPTNGYNYVTRGEDVFLYTGITSVLQDESNIGFVFINMRTKQTSYYPVSSAEEFSVMDSAAGSVQEKGYKATFPILINLRGRPTYFMALKDAAHLTKMYSLVDAQSYQKVAVGYTINDTLDQYMKITSDFDSSEYSNEDKSIIVEEIHPVVTDGNTLYYILANDDKTIYIASIDASEKLPFVKVGDTLNVKGSQRDNIFRITSIN